MRFFCNFADKYYKTIISMARKYKRKPYDYYGPVFGQLRREQGRKKTYLLFLVCTILECGLLYAFYWFSMKR